MFKRITLLMVCLLCYGTLVFGADQYKWPVRNIELIVPASAGGDTDFNARVMAKYFNKLTGVSMIITNMTGGGGTIGVSHVKDSKPDGSVMFFGHTGQMIVTQVSGLADYTLADFELCCIPAVEKSSVLVVRKSLGVNTLKELLDYSQKERVIFASELGGYSNIQALVIEKETGIKFDIVDIGSSAEKVTNILGGRVDAAVLSYGAVADYIKTGAMVALAQTGGVRNELIKVDIPTFTEGGFNFAMERQFIAAFPKGTDSEFVKQVGLAMKKVTEMPEYAKELENTYKQPVTFYGPEDAAVVLDKVYNDFMSFKSLMQ